MEYVWIVLVLAVMGAFWWIGYRMEPHWVSRDGQRFMCGSQEFFHGQLGGHPRETQVAFLGDGTLHITHKRMMRRQRTVWTLVGKSDDPPKNLEVYVAQQKVDGVGTSTMLALRIPKKSKCIALLDEALEKASTRSAPVTSASPTQPTRPSKPTRPTRPTKPTKPASPETS